jgi:hypothetical protein
MCGTHADRVRKAIAKGVQVDLETPIGQMRSRTSKGCAVPGCPNPHHARGLCSPHASRDWRAKHGELEKMPRPLWGFK